MIRLGGWDELSTSLGYIEYGRGRIWLVEANWRDLRAEMSDESRALMAAMIAGGGRPVYAKALPECMDLYDNDHDGLVDGRRCKEAACIDTDISKNNCKGL